MEVLPPQVEAKLKAQQPKKKQKKAPQPSPMTPRRPQAANFGIPHI